MKEKVTFINSVGCEISGLFTKAEISIYLANGKWKIKEMEEDAK